MPEPPEVKGYNQLLCVSRDLFLSEHDAPVNVKSKADRRTYSIADSIVMSLTIDNPGLRTLSLKFATAQFYDFMILSDGEVRWKWSSNKLFASVAREVVLEPKEEFTITEVLRAGSLSPGEYDLVGILTTDSPIRSQARFTVARNWAAARAKRKPVTFEEVPRVTRA